MGTAGIAYYSASFLFVLGFLSYVQHKTSFTNPIEGSPSNTTDIVSEDAALKHIGENDTVTESKTSNNTNNLQNTTNFQANDGELKNNITVPLNETQKHESGRGGMIKDFVESEAKYFNQVNSDNNQLQTEVDGGNSNQTGNPSIPAETNVNCNESCGNQQTANCPPCEPNNATENGTNCCTDSDNLTSPNAAPNLGDNSTQVEQNANGTTTKEQPALIRGFLNYIYYGKRVLPKCPCCSQTICKFKPKN